LPGVRILLILVIVCIVQENVDTIDCAVSLVVTFK